MKNLLLWEWKWRKHYPKSDVYYIFVDDERQPPSDLPSPWNDVCPAIFVAKDFHDAIGFIREIIWNAGTPDATILIDLDHDLGSEKTGYDICKYIVEHQISNMRYRIHSMNPVGRANMEQLLSHYGYKRF